jgi:predicted ATPase
MTGAAAAERIPISLVTGFLGSGKTTLIAALLKQPGMHGTAVVVNEFGAVGIDDASSPRPSTARTFFSSPMAASAAPPAMILPLPCSI